MDDMDRSDEIPTGIQQVGEFALKFIETIEQAYGEDAIIGAVGIVAEVNFKSGPGSCDAIAAWSTEERPWVQTALFEKAAETSRFNESC